ncbi:hypothetical protein AB4140_13720 [Shewanella sp. 10N.286.51.B2]|uniref:hypothetical protein n=1 Tax=Shewanella sp. 10N.286.51.B2 TaxID=3229707 RepID=UPI0035507C40
MNNKTILPLTICISILLSGCKSTTHSTLEPAKSLAIENVVLYLDDIKKKEAQGDFERLYDVWIKPNFKDFYGDSHNYHYTGGAGSEYKEVNSKAFLQGFSDFCKSNGFSLQTSSTSIKKEVAEVYTCIDSNNVELAQIQISDNWHIFNTQTHLKKEKLKAEFDLKRKDHFTKYTGYNGPTGELHFKDGSRYEFIRIGNFNSKKDILISVRDLQQFLTPIKDLYLNNISSFSINSDGLATDIRFRNGSSYDVKSTNNHAIFEIDHANKAHWFEHQFVVKHPMNGELFTLLNSDRSIEKVVINQPEVWKKLNLEILPSGNGDAFRKSSVQTHREKIGSLKSELSAKGQSYLIPKGGETISEHLNSSVRSELKRFSRECKGREHIDGAEKSKLVDIQDCYQARKELILLNKGYSLGMIETPIAYYSLLLTIKNDLL